MSVPNQNAVHIFTTAQVMFEMDENIDEWGFPDGVESESDDPTCFPSYENGILNNNTYE